MKRIFFPTALLALMAIPFVGGIVDAATIAGVTIHDVSSELTTSFDRDAVHAVDGSGLTGLQHTSADDFFMWLNSGNGCCGDPADPTAAGVGAVITFDLGANYDLNSMRVWNYNESPVGFTARGANEVEILIDDEVAGTSFVSVGNINLSQAPGSNTYTGEVVDFVAEAINANNVRLLRFNITSNHGGDNEFIGLSEIQFDGVLTPVVPEPAAIAMWTLVGLVASGAYLIRRRRKRNA